MATVITNTDIGNNLFIGFTKLNAREQLTGSNYRVVYANNTPENNAIALYSAYQFAKIQNPNGGPKSDTNRFVIFLAPGRYTFNLGFPTELDLDTPYIDIVSLSGEADVTITSLATNIPLKVSTSDIKLRGINLEGQSIQINSSYGNNYFENIIGGERNFSNDFLNGDIAGNFKNCVGGIYSFGDSNYNQTIYNSTFENCTAGDWSFGYNVLDSKFKNCTAAFSSFGLKSLQNCILTDCKAGGYSFGTESGIKDSKLTNCTGKGGYCFGRANGTSQLLNTTFTNCNAFEGSFGFYIEDCTFLNCKANENSYGMTSDINIVSEIYNTTFTNCKAGNNSFGVNNGGNVTFTDCIAGQESFGADKANGIYKNCTAGNNSFGAGLQGWGTLQAGGQFYNCVAGEYSFGTEYANGEFYYCVCNNNGGWIGNTQIGMGGYAFSCKGMHPIGPGTAVYCIDKVGNPVNFGLASTTNNI